MGMRISGTSISIPTIGSGCSKPSSSSARYPADASLPASGIETASTAGSTTSCSSAGADGQPVEIVGSWRDVTEQEQAQQQLLAEKPLAFAVDGSDLGLWDWSLADDTVFFSTRWKTMLGYSGYRDRLPALGMGVAHPPHDRARVMADVQRHLRGEADFYVNEHRVRCKDGSYNGSWTGARSSSATSGARCCASAPIPT